MHDTAAMMRRILHGYALFVRGDHGVVHWARVLENGLRVADATGADREVVTLFALFHDARRVNEYHDPGHGRRGGELARSLRGSLIHLDDARFALLFEACRLHTDGLTAADPTLQACWDADRLRLLPKQTTRARRQGNPRKPADYAAHFPMQKRPRFSHNLTPQSARNLFPPAMTPILLWGCPTANAVALNNLDNSRGFSSAICRVFSGPNRTFPSPEGHRQGGNTSRIEVFPDEIRADRGRLDTAFPRGRAKAPRRGPVSGKAQSHG